jgi:serine/threonine protein kinase/Tol biopolymer transport system component
MTIATGTRLGPYEILTPLGTGGMGEVYRARDAKLNRYVAIKILPEAFAHDDEWVSRFKREAQVLASLNHPNIAAIYGLEESNGAHGLVMELVEGATIAERIALGPIALSESLPIASQIIEALEYAHEKGVIHRDLKPANIKIAPDGAVKILDFGLAKVFGDDAVVQDSKLSHSPTLIRGTQAGMILGTAAYMSPEQAQGKPVDKRSDIWSFGVVLCEMLTGRQLFAGETVSDIIAAVLRDKVDWSALPADTPPSLRKLLGRCLERDRKRRLRDIGDARNEIADMLSDDPVAASESSAVIASPNTRWREIAWSLAVLLAVAVGWILLRPASATPNVPLHLSITLGPTQELGREGDLLVALSPDGSRLVFVAHQGSEREQLYSRQMDGPEIKPIPGTAGAANPCFSPDGKWVLFYADNKLKKVSLDGGEPQVVCDASWGGASWGPGDTIVFTRDYNTGLWRVPAAGGVPVELTSPDLPKGELGHLWPQILPDGKSVVFTAFSTPMEKASIVVLSLETRKQQVLIEGGIFAHYVSTGHLVYARGKTMMAVPFDLGSLKVTGPAVSVLEDVPAHSSTGNSQFSISENGVLAYIPASAWSNERTLVSVDRQGVARSLTDRLKAYAEPRLSPNVRRLAITIGDGNKSNDVWIYELDREVLTRLTSGPTAEFNPIWTPDGKRIIFSLESPVYNLFWKAADGSGAEEPLFTNGNDKYPGSVSPDGKTLAFGEQHPETRFDVFVLPLEGERRPRPFLQTPFMEYRPAFSPDGHWLAYQSNQSGRDEVYVQAYPGPGGKVQVSTDGGSEPVWAQSGKELFYRSGRKVLSVPIINSGAEFVAGKPVQLFEGPYSSDQYRPGYDVTPDGQRFMMVQVPEGSAPRQINVIVNWFEELRRRVSTDQK